MTVMIYTAPAAGGKTRYCLDLARQRTNGLAEEVRVVVPTRQQAAAWRTRLAVAGGAIGVRVMTYDELVNVCLDAVGEAYTEIFQPVQRQLLQRLIESTDLAHYASLQDKIGFVTVMQTLIAELKAGRIQPQAFREACAALFDDDPRLSELATLYDAYQRLLQERGEADRAGLGWLAVESLARTSTACSEWPLLIIDGFDDFTPIQLALLRTLAGRVREMIVTLPQAEQAKFNRYAYTRRVVEETLEQTAVALPAAVTVPPNPALAHLSQTVFDRAGQPSAPVDGLDGISLVEAPDPAGEVRTALRWLKQQMVERGAEATDVALLARDLTPYRPFIEPVAAEFGLPVWLVDGTPLRQNPAVDALLELLLLHLPDDAGRPALTRREVVATWRSPYFDWGEETPLIAPGDADRLDFLARQFRVIRGREQWEAAFRTAEVAWSRDEAQDEEAGEEATFLLSPDPAVATRLGQKFDWFYEWTKPPEDATSMGEFVRWLEDLIGPDPESEPSEPGSLASRNVVAQARQTPETAAADVAALRALKEVLRGLLAAEDAAPRAEMITFGAFFRELLAAVQATMVPAEPVNGGEVILAADVIYARGLSFAAVAILGLGEGSFPATIAEDPFLRDADRTRLAEADDFPLRLSTLSSEQELFYDGITRAREALLLTRSLLADNGAEWVASPYWDEVARLLNLQPERLSAEYLPPPNMAASWAELWQCAATDDAVADYAADHLPGVWQAVEDGALIWRGRASRTFAPWDGRLDEEAEELAIAFGPDTIWSPSRLESYRSCPHTFFFGHVLSLSPRPEPAEGLDSRQLGHLYHTIFEKVYANGVTEVDEAGLEAFVRRIAHPILDAAPQKEGFRETPWWSQTREEIIANVVQSIVSLDAESDFRFLQAEAVFGFGGHPPLVLDGDGDRRLLLRGVIDRVDRDEEGRIRVIDYKLGGKSGFSKTAFAQGKKLQLPLYALAAEKALRLGPVADGFYWHFTKPEASGFRLAGQVDDAVQTTLSYTWESIQAIRSGVFEPRPPDGGCPDYCPAASFCWHYTRGFSF